MYVIIISYFNPTSCTSFSFYQEQVIYINVCKIQKICKLFLERNPGACHYDQISINLYAFSNLLHTIKIYIMYK